jgi:hypothetical protein
MRRAASTLSVLLAAACSTTVYGPGVLVLPGTGKTFDQFRFDEQDCRSHAQARLAGTESEYDSAGSMQQRYDRAFLQCMYAKGHKVPVSGRYTEERQPQAAAETRPPPPQGEPPAEAPPDFRPK